MADLTGQPANSGFTGVALGKPILSEDRVPSGEVVNPTLRCQIGLRLLVRSRSAWQAQCFRELLTFSSGNFETLPGGNKPVPVFANRLSRNGPGTPVSENATEIEFQNFGMVRGGRL